MSWRSAPCDKTSQASPQSCTRGKEGRAEPLWRASSALTIDGTTRHAAHKAAVQRNPMTIIRTMGAAALLALVASVGGSPLTAVTGAAQGGNTARPVISYATRTDVSRPVRE